MAHLILSHITASVAELKKHPLATVASAEGEALAILSHNQPVFYCVPAPLYESMLEILEDIELSQLIKERCLEEEITVDLDNL